MKDNGNGTYIDVEPFATKPERSHFKTQYGWYHHCFFDLKLYSGHHHNYKDNEYGLSKELPPGPVEGKEEYVRIKKGGMRTIGTVLGLPLTQRRASSRFVMSGINCGVAFEGIHT